MYRSGTRIRLYFIAYRGIRKGNCILWGDLSFLDVPPTFYYIVYTTHIYTQTNILSPNVRLKCLFIKSFFACLFYATRTVVYAYGDFNDSFTHSMIFLRFMRFPWPSF